MNEQNANANTEAASVPSDGHEPPADVPRDGYAPPADVPGDGYAIHQVVAGEDQSAPVPAFPPSAAWPPPPTTQLVSSAYAQPPRFLPLSRLALGLYILLGLQCVLQPAALFFSGKEATTVGLSIAILTLPLSFTGFVLLLVWTYRAYGNLASFGATQLASTPALAVAYHFIPILMFFKPFQIYAEIARASDPKNAGITRASRRKARSVPAILLWGVVYLIYKVILTFMLSSMGQGQTDPVAPKVVAMLTLTQILLTVLVVTAITRRQNEKVQLVSIRQ